MKTIAEILELTKNPYYTLTRDEQAVLDDFLAKKQARDSSTPQNPNSQNSEESTPVIVRNIVQKAPTYPPEAPENV